MQFSPRSVLLHCCLTSYPSHLTSCTPTKSNLYHSISPTTDLIAPTLPRLLIFQVPNLMSFLQCLVLAKELVWVRGALKHFATNYFFMVRGC
jgi:hypothetical protein